MKDEIKKQIRDEFEVVLSEIDLDSEIERLLGKGKLREKVETVIHDEITRQLSYAVQTTIMKAVRKRQPLLDVFAEAKVRELFSKMVAATERL